MADSRHTTAPILCAYLYGVKLDVQPMNMRRDRDNPCASCEPGAIHFDQRLARTGSTVAVHRIEVIDGPVITDLLARYAEDV